LTLWLKAAMMFFGNWPNFFKNWQNFFGVLAGKQFWDWQHWL
jgi:hypothetical protein